MAERPYDAEVYNDLGNLLILDHRLEEAEDAYRKAIELEPANTLARFNLGVLLAQEGRTREAQEELKALLEYDDRHGKAYYQLGVLYEDRGQRGRAIEHYARAFAYDPDLTFARNNPHLIDNGLATEAMLRSNRYIEPSATETPRLYGEPERIADLMLSDLAEAERPVEVADPESEGEEEEPPATSSTGRGSRLDAGGGETGGPGRRPGRAPAGGRAEEPRRDDSGGSPGVVSNGGRRVLTPSDLDSDSNVGQVQRGPSRRRPAIGVGDSSGRRGGAAGRRSTTRSRGDSSTATQPPPRLPGASVSDASNASGRSTRSRRPSYRPRSRLSTGRLELQLLPVQETTERYAEHGTGSQSVTWSQNGTVPVG
ncbi:MAG: tetratricopeptide repeat protein [Acidobacteriota bacterium]